MADTKGIWSFRVMTDSGKRYTLEVKGDLKSLTAGVLKPELAKSSGVLVDKQVLSYNGEELADNMSFETLGIKADAELYLSQRATEVQYYTDVLCDAIAGFDAALKEGGGAKEVAALPDNLKENVLKLLKRKVTAMQKHHKALAEETAYVRTEPDRTTLRARVETERQRMEERMSVYNILVAGGEAFRGGAFENLRDEQRSSIERLADALGRALLSFDAAVGEKEQGFHALGQVRKTDVLDDLLRRLVDVQQCFREMAQGMVAVDGAAERTALFVELDKDRQRVEERRAVVARLACPTHTPHGRMAKAAPRLSPAMQAFYERVHSIYTGIEDVRRRHDSPSPIAGAHLKLCVALKVLRGDVLASASTCTAVEHAIMQSVMTDCRTQLVATLRNYLGSPARDEVSVREVVLAFNDPAVPVLEAHVVADDIATATVVRDALRGQADPQTVLVLLYDAAGMKRAPTLRAKDVDVGDGAPPSDAPQQLLLAPFAGNGGGGRGSSPTGPNPDVVAALRAGKYWSAHVHLFYLKYNPDNVGSIDRIVGEYRGNEDKLFAHLFEKYYLTDVDREELQNEYLDLLKHLNITDPAARQVVQKRTGGDDGCIVM